jgi:hypothetical protein
VHLTMLSAGTVKSQLREARLSLSAVGRLEARATASNFLQRLWAQGGTPGADGDSAGPTPEVQAISVSRALSTAADTLFEAATPSGGAPPMLFSPKSGAGGLAIQLPGDADEQEEEEEG